jgi:Domain of unknown function (DUF5658)
LALAENTIMKSLSRAAVASALPLSDGAPALAVGDTATPAARPLLRPAIAATAIGVVVFLLIQGILAAYNVHVVQDAISRGVVGGYPSVFLSLRLRLLTAVIVGGISYPLFAFVGMVVASRGHRLLFLLPAASFVLVAVIGTGYGHQPQAIGTQWQIQCFSMNDTCTGPWFAHPWFGPLVDLALVLIPGWVVAVRVRARRWPGMADAPAIAASLATVALVAMAGWTIAVIESSVDLRAVVTVGVFGLAIGTSRPWWPWLHVLFATLVAGALVSIASSLLFPYPGFSLLEALRYEAKNAWPIVVIGLLASGWQPLAWVFRRMQERPLRLVVAVNILNVVDAVMTTLAVRSGGAVEANPFVRFGGLPLKIVLVGALTWLLYRRRPASLVWPAAALLWVACYHVGGILVNGFWLR